MDSGACSPPTEEVVPGAELLNDSLAATVESELRSRHIVPSRPHQHNEKILQSPPEPAQHNLNRKIGLSPLRRVTTADQASESRSPPRLSSRLHQAFSGSDSNDSILNNATLVEFDSLESLVSTPSGNSIPKSGTNTTGFAPRGDLQLSRHPSQRSSNNLPNNDPPQPKNTKQVQTDNLRASDNDIIIKDNDIISPQGESFLSSSSKVHTTTTKVGSTKQIWDSPQGRPYTAHKAGTRRKSAEQAESSLSSVVDNSLDRESILPSENAVPNRDQTYSFRMSDNYPEYGMLDQEETPDQMNSFEPDEFYTNYFMTDEEYALRLQADEYGQAFEEPSVSAVPTAARFSNIRDESPSEEEVGTLRAIAGRVK